MSESLESKKLKDKELSNYEVRLSMGEAHMMCNDCGAKLYSFDGFHDSSRNCPYQKYGKCEL